MKENQTATYFLHSRLFTYHIMKNFNYNIIYLWFFKSKFRSYIILFTNYDITTDFLNLAFCSEHFISTGIKHRILATLNINKKFNSDSLCAFNTPHQKLNSSKYQITTHLLLFHIVTTHSRLFTYHIMKNFNYNIIYLWFFKSKFRSYIGKHFFKLK
jgi:hypothetical protein